MTAARPGMAELRPIIVDDWPQVSSVRAPSGMLIPKEIPAIASVSRISIIFLFTLVITVTQ